MTSSFCNRLKYKASRKKNKKYAHTEIRSYNEAKGDVTSVDTILVDVTVNVSRAQNVQGCRGMPLKQHFNDSPNFSFDSALNPNVSPFCPGNDDRICPLVNPNAKPFFPYTHSQHFRRLNHNAVPFSPNVALNPNAATFSPNSLNHLNDGNLDNNTCEDFVLNTTPSAFDISTPALSEID